MVMVNDIQVGEGQARCIEELIKNKDFLVPVIGDELFYVEKEDGTQCPLQEFIVEQFENDEDFQGVAEKVSEEEKKLMREGGYDGLTLLSHCYNVRGDYQERYIRYIDNNRRRIKLNGTIKEYIRRTNPKLIITTSPFSLIEEELGYDKNNHSFWYLTDDEDKTKYKERLMPEKIVFYHLFGYAEVPRPNWVYDEISLLEFMHCLHENDSSPDGLTQYLKKERKLLLILGCKLPNWFFQFILYPLDKDIFFSRGARQGFWLKHLDEEPSLALKSFLDGINFLSIKNIEEIVAKVNEKLMVVSASENETDENYDIFISHAGEDSESAIKVAEILEKSGLRVWIDRNRGKGETEKAGDYLERIKYGIQHSRYFMPIVTSFYVSKCRQGDFGEETQTAIDWYKNEKNECNKEGEFKVYSLPVVKDRGAYDLGKTFNVLPEELFGKNHCYFYTEDVNDTFLNHPWNNFKRRKK